MMAFIKHQPPDAIGRGFFFVGFRRSHGRINRHLMQHQRVIGHNDIRLAARARGLLDEAFAVMRASRIDALPALVRKAQGKRRARVFMARIGKQAHEPGGKITTAHVTILGVPRPARDEPGHECPARAPLHALHGFLHVEQAQIILPAFANHNALAAFFRVSHQLGRFLLQLSLEIFGIGRNPHRCLIAPRPQKRGRQISQCLAQARSGLCQQDMIGMWRFTRRECLGGFSRIKPLCGAFF